MADSHAELPHVRKGLPYYVARHLLLERFPSALKGLMEERHLSYRQLAYMTRLSAGYLNHLTQGTRPVPTDPMIRRLIRSSRCACFAKDRTCSEVKSSRRHQIDPNIASPCRPEA